MDGERVLVTGATGFLGSNLVRHLLGRGCQVGVLVRKQSPRVRIAELAGRLCLLEGDLCDASSLHEAVTRFAPGYVLHVAAYGVNRWEAEAEQAAQTNVVGTVRLLEACRRVPLKSFVYVGSCFEYGDQSTPCREEQLPRPLNAYAASKTGAWLYCHLYGRQFDLPVVSVRPFHTYGPYESPRRLVPYVILSALEGKEIGLTKSEQVRDFVFVEDVADGIVRAARTQAAQGQTINLGTGRGTSVRAMVGQIMGLVPSPVEPRFGARAYRQGEAWNLVADVSRARELLGWEARVSLREGLQRTVAWFRANARLAASISED
jgi:UDP-glucose 4-epimerase